MLKKYTPRLYLEKNEISKEQDIKFIDDKHAQLILNKGKHSSKQHWIDLKMEENEMFINSNEIQIGLNKSNGVLFMCTPNLLMIDFDTENDEEKNNVIKLSTKFVKILEQSTKEKYLFNVYETDNGIHLFLTSHQINSIKINVIKLMYELHSDYNYIIHSVFRGFCIRIGPKIMKGRNDDGYIIVSREEMEKIFIARPCFNEICTIGNGKPLKKLLNLVELSYDFILLFKDYYLLNFKNFNSKNILPTDKMMKQIQYIIAEVLDIYKIDIGGEYPFKCNECSLYNEYEDILGIEEYKRSKKYNIFEIYLIKEELNKNINRDDIIYLIGKPPKLSNDKIYN